MWSRIIAVDIAAIMIRTSMRSVALLMAMPIVMKIVLVA